MLRKIKLLLTNTKSFHRIRGSLRKSYPSLFVLLFFSLIYTIFFSPVLFANQLLAPGDGIVQSVTAFYSTRTLWTNLLWAGFPAAADTTVQTWYPLSFLISLIPNSWNAFVIAAYVLASFFSYGYVYTLTNSKLAAYVGGIVFGMSGFMMGHLGHTSMIHTAAWMPLMLWALENLRQRFSTRWFLIGCFAVACSILAGHPQITVYSVGLSIAYVLFFGWLLPHGKLNYYKTALTVIVVGVALAAIQILPTAELMNLGLRSSLNFQDFIIYSLRPEHTIQLLFPYIFGGVPEFEGVLQGEGYAGLTEMGGYVGLLSLVLSLIGFLQCPNKFLAAFWGIVAVFSLLLTLGDTTPLAQLMFHTPAYNKFRIPARHFIEMTMAISVLAGLGTATVQKQIVSRKQLTLILAGATSIFFASFLGAFTFLKPLLQERQELAPQQNLFLLNLASWSKPAIIVPLIIFLLAITVILLWHKLRDSRYMKAVIVLALILDLGSFGWFYEWRHVSPDVSVLIPTASAQRYENLLETNNQRLLPIQGGLASLDEIPPNLSRLWRTPSASGYGPFILSRVSQLMSMAAAGQIPDNQILTPGVSQGWNLMAVRYLSVPNKTSPKISSQGISWDSDNLSLTSGSCGQEQSRPIKLLIPAPKSGKNFSSINQIGIVSSMGCSTALMNGEKILEARLINDSGEVSIQTLRAGIDTSEWAYDCSDVRSSVKHDRATIFESFLVEREGVSRCKGHKYVSIQPIDKLENIKAIEFNWVGQSGGISIDKVSFVGQGNQSYPITKLSTLLADTEHWRYIEDFGKASIYENLKAMPRVWLVPEAVILTSEAVLSSIQSSTLPDGRVYDPTKLALLEEPLDFKVANFDPDATAKLVSLNDSSVQIQTSSKSSAFLVLSDIYYPGWKARVDGKLTHIFQTNYVLRGIPLSEGNHIIEFTFEPTSFHIGTGISVAALAWLMYLSLKQKNQKIVEQDT